MCINCNIKLPVPKSFCDVFGLHRDALMSIREVSRYAMKFDYSTLSPKKKSLLFFLLGTNIDEALKHYDECVVERNNSTGKGGVLSMIFPDLWEIHPVGVAVCRAMEKSVPGLYYATIQYFRVVDKQMQQAQNGKPYLTGKYTLIDGATNPLEPITTGNWEYFQTMYDV